MYFLLITFFSVCVVAKFQKEALPRFHLSYIPVETKTCLMIQFPLLIICENKQVWDSFLFSSVKDPFEKETPSECVKDFLKNLLKSEMQKFQEKS